MSTLPSVEPSRAGLPTHDDIIVLRGLTWADFERLLEIRGQAGVPRFHYLEGALEIMSPGRDHEEIKSVIGCLVEAWCLEQGIDFTTVGSWLQKDERVERGAEPDESYVFGPGPVEDGDRSDLAIEVLWSHGGLDKLEIYRKLQVREVWIWKKDGLTPWILEGERYVGAEASTVLPELDLAWLGSFVSIRPTSAAIRALQHALRQP